MQPFFIYKARETKITRFLNINEVKFIKNINNKKYRLFSVFNSNFPRASVGFQRKLAITKLNKLGNYNFIQGTVVRNKKVIAIEDKDGTEKMLKKCKNKKLQA